MNLGKHFRSQGQLYLRRAEIHGQLRVEGSLTAPPDEKTEPQGADVVFHLEAATAGRALAFKPKQIDGGVNLINAKLGYLRDFGGVWWQEKTSAYALYGLDFGQLAARENKRTTEAGIQKVRTGLGHGSWRRTRLYRSVKRSATRTAAAGARPP